MRHQRVCLGLILDASKARITKSIACFYMLKRQFVNSRVYNFRSRKPVLSKILGVSVKTMNKYLEILDQLGLIYEECGVLVLKPNRRVRQIFGEKRIYKISLGRDDSLADIEARLLCKLIECQGRKISRAEAIRRFEKRRFNKPTKRLKKAQGGGNQLNKVLRESPPFEPSMSVRSIAKLLFVNERTVIKLIDRMNRLGIVRTKVQKPVCVGDSDVRASKYFQDNHGHFFVFKKKLYCQYGLIWKFLEFPIFQKPLTGSAYIKFIRNAKR
jgi:DNA-binding transcriptional regulator YhcF (GntR family)